MMKIHNYLLVSISYISLCSLAQADISAVDNEFIFTHTSNTHLASQPQLLSSSNLPQTLSEHRDLFLAEPDTANRWLTASVCFITDARNCSGNKYGGANTPDNSSSGGIPNGNSSGSSSSGGDEDWTIDNRKRCELEGYKLTSCPALKVPQNYCPYDISYFEKCVCKAGLVTCTKPYYGVGESCDGKYASCKLDNARGCKE